MEGGPCGFSAEVNWLGSFQVYQSFKMGRLKNKAQAELCICQALQFDICLRHDWCDLADKTVDSRRPLPYQRTGMPERHTIDPRGVILCDEIDKIEVEA